MTSATRRAPHRELLAWKDGTSSAAVVAQLLYIYQRLDYPFDTDAFSKTIKRDPQEPQATSGWQDLFNRHTEHDPRTLQDLNDGLAFLLGEGFIFKTVDSYDMAKLCDIDYYRGVLMDKGWTEAKANSYQPSEHELVIKYVEDRLELKRNYPQQYISEQGRTDWSTVDALLDEEYIVEVGLKTRAPNVYRPLLVVEGNVLFYTLYDPRKGVSRQMVFSDFADGMVQGVCGYKLG